MDNVDERHMALLQSRLLAREAQLRGEIDATVAKSSGESHVRVAEAARDAADDSFSNLIVDTNIAEVDRDLGELRRIGAALRRMKEGSYGSCEDCGKRIPEERLEAEPTALRCVACQERYEKMHATGATPAL